MRRWVLSLALLVGVLAGAAGAAVRPDEHVAPPRAQASVWAAATPVPFGRLPDGRYAPGFLQARVKHPRLVARAADPAGGPEWAIRLADVDFLKIDTPTRTLAGAKVVSRRQCVQLGRLQGETFGWVYGAGGFRPERFDDRTALCHTAKRREPAASMVSALAIGADPSAPRITANAVFGFIPGAKSAEVTGTDGADGQAQGADEAFLRVVGADARLKLGARLGGVLLTAGPIPADRADRYSTLRPETERLEAPAPDIAGGPGWAVPVAESEQGRPCVGSPQQVVDGRAGGVDLERALFWPSVLPASACRALSWHLTDERPCDWSMGGQTWGYGTGDAFLARAAIERRTFSGRFVVRGECREDVERVTISTPRDTRTLKPSELGHAVIAVYDGGYVDGEIRFTMHLRGGGKTVSDGFPFGFR